MENEETTKDSKKSNSQISFRAPELKEKLEDAARAKGLTLADYMKELCELSLQQQTQIKPALKPARTAANKEAEPGNGFIVLLQENNDKHDQVINLLGRLVETTQPAENEIDLVYSEEEHSSALGQALMEQEREIRKEHLLIRLTEEQQSVINKLLDYRKEKGKIFSGSIEELFFYVLKETMYSTFWNVGHPEFDTEFKNAFADYFEQIKF